VRLFLPLLLDYQESFQIRLVLFVVLEAYSKRLQIQEQLTQQIAQALFEKIPDNQGVMVEINARHMCVELRGIRSVGNITKTTSRYGIYKE
jgi:GTP cyclohydrolase I